MSGTDDLAKRILAEYNSISPSRRRWIRNRGWLRNNWREFFDLLEAVSGRPTNKIELFDENWHEIGEKAKGVRGAKNKKLKDIDINSFAVSPDEKAKRLADAKKSVVKQNNEARHVVAEELRDLSVAEDKAGEKEKNVKTAPAHVKVPGEEPRKQLDRVKGDPHATETNKPGLQPVSKDVDDRTQQERQAGVTTSGMAQLQLEDNDTAGTQVDNSKTTEDTKSEKTVKTPADSQGKATSQSQGSEDGKSTVTDEVKGNTEADVAKKQAEQSEAKAEAERGAGKTVKPAAGAERQAEVKKELNSPEVKSEQKADKARSAGGDSK